MASYFLCVAKRKWRKEKATLAAAKARSKKCVQGDSATRSSLPLLAQTLLVLKPWPPIFERLAAKGLGVIVSFTFFTVSFERCILSTKIDVYMAKIKICPLRFGVVVC
ncbi:hypothetical protein WH43_04535 [Rheinheimera sp. KL1]|nr:hypothetical protein WH43_04535 [Rheinheimera sp. KL1]